MINISVDEGFAFDMLSISEVKYNVAETDENEENFERIKLDIYRAIGSELLNKILDSKEYERLFIANWNVFKLVDAVKTQTCLGGDVDKANYERFLAKKALQEKYFNSKYSEVKIGYAPIH